MARTRRGLLATLVALSVVLGSGAFAGTAAANTTLDITGTSLPDSVTQGDSFDLTVSVNGEELENDEVDVSLTVPDGLSCTPAGTQTVTLTDNTAEATFECDADVEGDYTGEITVSASGVSSGNDEDPSRTTQAGLEVLSPASLTIATSIGSSSINEGSSTTLTAVVNNLGDASTSYTLSLSGASGYTATLSDGSESGTVRGGEVTTVTYTITGDTGGDYDLTASLTGGNGQSLSATETLSVASSGGSGGGGGSTTTDDSDEDSDDGTEDTAADDDGPLGDAVENGSGTGPVNTSVVDDVVETTVDDADAGETVGIDLADSPVASTTDDGVGLRNVELSFEASADFEATIDDGAEDAPRLDGDQPTPGADSEGGSDSDDGSSAGAALNYVTVDHDTSDEAIETVTFTFDVTQSTLDERDVAADELAVYRHDGSEWGELDTRVGERSNDTVTLVAESPGLSTFAVAPAGDGNEATATATATPTPDPTATPDSTPTPDPTATPDPTPTASPEPSPTTSTDGPGFTVAVGLLALLGAALVAARRD